MPFANDLTSFGFGWDRHRPRPRLRVVEPPTGLALDLALTKAHIRVEDDESDDLINAYIAAATQSVIYLGRALQVTTFALDLCELPHEIELPKPPAVSVSSITYTDPAGTPGTLDPSLYALAISEEGFGTITRKHGATYPPVRGDLGSAVVTFVAGYDTLPQPLAVGLMMMVGQLFDNRADISPAMQYAIPRGIDMMLQPYRIRDFP